MSKVLELLRQGKKKELWQRCCGFLDLSLDEFMEIQRRLLLEQLERLRNCELGRRLMRGAEARTVEEFREEVPLTTYADYIPELPKRREDVLPAKVARWVRTSGRSGEHDVKWIPWSERFVQECEEIAAALVILAFCEERGDVSKIKEGMKALYTVGGPEYGTGAIGDLCQRAINFQFLPTKGQYGSWMEKVKAGFNEALYRSLDGFGGLPSVLVAVGEQIRQGAIKPDIRSLLAHPQALLRLAKGLLKSKLARRPLLPKDLWSVKGIIGGGIDAAVFAEKVRELWGRYPLETYAGTEGGIYAIQTWDYEGLTFVPNLNFFEFIPEEEHNKWRSDPSYRPKTVLLNEVKAGQNYEVIITNFHGGILTRLKIGDMIRIISLRNEKLNIDIPQMMFYSRADEIIDITGLGHITERIIWKAIEKAGIPYVEWVARRELANAKPVLHIYIETKGAQFNEQEVVEAIYRELKNLNAHYQFNLYDTIIDNFASTIGLKPLKVTLLPPGTFAGYLAQREAEGADLGHLKPPHINPSERVMAALLSIAALVSSSA